MLFATLARSLMRISGQRLLPTVKAPYRPLPAPAELKTVTSKLPVSIEAASLRLTVKPGAPTGVAVPGHFYILEAVDKDGNTERLRRVQSFEFKATARGEGQVTITYFDHGPAAVGPVLGE